MNLQPSLLPVFALLVQGRLFLVLALPYQMYIKYVSINEKYPNFKITEQEFKQRERERKRGKGRERGVLPTWNQTPSA